MKRALVLTAIALLAITGCSAEQPAESAPEPETKVSDLAPEQPELPKLSADQIEQLQQGISEITPVTLRGANETAKEVCYQILDGAHGEGFTRGVALRFGAPEGTGGDIVQVIKNVGVCK